MASCVDHGDSMPCGTCAAIARRAIAAPVVIPSLNNLPEGMLDGPGMPTEYSTNVPPDLPPVYSNPSTNNRIVPIPADPIVLAATAYSNAKARLKEAKEKAKSWAAKATKASDEVYQTKLALTKATEAADGEA